jgi:hypothetical protein
MGVFGLALTLIVAGFSVLFFAQFWSSELALYRNPRVPRNQFLRSVQDFSPVVIFIGASWLGSLVFYGDNVRRRCVFFADRGIAPTKIWLTRLLLPSVFCLLLLAVAVLAQSNLNQSRRDLGAFPIIIAVNFAFGQLVGQWTKRPVLAFFAAPAYAGAAMLIVFAMLGYYPTYYPRALLVVPILLIASWQLSSRWLSGRIDLGYHCRAVTYTALAVSLPMLAIVWTRVASTPELMPQWRASVMAIDVPAVNVYSDRHLIDTHPIFPDAFVWSGVTSSFERASIAEQNALLGQELESNSIGEFVSLDDLNSVLNGPGSGNIERNKKAIEVALKWAREIREHVIAGRCTFSDFDRGAEWAESTAVAALENMLSSDLARPIPVELVRSIPDHELRKQSRRIGLINEWRAYQAADWIQEFPGYTYYGKNFMDNPVATDVAVFPFERTRADRYVDRLTRLLLDQLENGLPEAEADPAFRQRSRLWNEAVSPKRSGSTQLLHAAQTWTEDYERRIDLLKARYGVEPN